MRARATAPNGCERATTSLVPLRRAVIVPLRGSMRATVVSETLQLHVAASGLVPPHPKTAACSVIVSPRRNNWEPGVIRACRSAGQGGSGMTASVLRQFADNSCVASMMMCLLLTRNFESLSGRCDRFCVDTHDGAYAHIQRTSSQCVRPCESATRGTTWTPGQNIHTLREAYAEHHCDVVTVRCLQFASTPRISESSHRPRSSRRCTMAHPVKRDRGAVCASKRSALQHASSIEDGKIFAPRAHGLSILFGHHARDLRNVSKVMRDPRGQ